MFENLDILWHQVNFQQLSVSSRRAAFKSQKWVLKSSLPSSYPCL